MPDLGHLVKDFDFIFKSFSSFPKVLGRPTVKKDHLDCMRDLVRGGKNGNGPESSYCIGL